MKQIADRIEAHQAAMYAVCLRVLRHPQDAEDACQEAMLEAARQADTVREDFGAWARRVALTTALDVRRRRERRKTHEAQVRPPERSEQEPVEIDRALAALDEPSRRAVAAHYLDCRPLRELAREAGVSEVAIWKRLAKAKGKLRVLFAAILPAALIGAAVLLVLLRHPAVVPEQPATPQEREPWPWELPPRAWPEPVRASWKALQTRMTIDVQNAPAADILREIERKIGRPITVAAGAIEAEETVSFKVQDIVGDGALRLLLQPRGKGYRIRDDGTILVDLIEALDAAAPDRNQSDEIQRAWQLQEARRQTWPSRPLMQIEAALARRVREPEGVLSLEAYLASLRDASGAHIVIDAAALTEDLRDVRVAARGEEASLETHLRRLPVSANLVPVPSLEGVVLLTRPESVAERLASSDLRAQKRIELAMDGPLDSKDVATVPQLVRRLEKYLGVPVLATREAWESKAAVVPAPGATPRDVLDGLAPQGVRWAVRDGALFILK